MKKKISLIILVTYASLSITQAQPGVKWDLGGNAVGLNSYLGSTNAQPLLFKTEQPQNINFYTNAGAGSFLNGRMTILGNYFLQGLIGIGDMGTNCSFIPQSQLHQHKDGSFSLYHQFTNGYSGSTANDGFLIGMAFNGL